MSDRRKQIGRLGERLASHRLEQQGYRVIERNYRTREGEIDLIVARDKTLVFCEVKTLVARASTRQGPANVLEAVGAAKRAQIRRMAKAWLAERSAAGTAPRCPNARFDAIGVLVSPAGRLLRLDHVEAAF